MKITNTLILTFITIISSVIYINNDNPEDAVPFSIALSALWVYTLLRWLMTVLLFDAIKAPCSKEWLVKIIFAEHKFQYIVTPIFFTIINFVGIQITEYTIVRYILIFTAIPNILLLGFNIVRLKKEYERVKKMLM